jgi:hypothetical protein
MGKVAPPKKNQRSPRMKVDTAIVLAVIGLCATVLAALLASPALVALINQNHNSPTVPPAEKSGLQLPEVIETVAGTATSPPSATPTSFPLGQAWTSILRLDLGTPCSPLLLPPTINPNEDISVAEQQVKQAMDNQEYVNWLVAPTLEDDEDGVASLVVSSIVTETEWVKISNELLIDVTAQEEIPDHANILKRDRFGRKATFYGGCQCCVSAFPNDLNSLDLTPKSSSSSIRT